MARKKPVTYKFDPVDHAVAFAVMTSSAADQNEKIGVPIQSLIEDVRSCLSGIVVSFRELRNRIASWVNRGWGTMQNNIFLPSKTGRYFLSKMAAAAA